MPHAHTAAMTDFVVNVQQRGSSFVAKSVGCKDRKKKEGGGELLRLLVPALEPDRAESDSSALVCVDVKKCVYV